MQSRNRLTLLSLALFAVTSSALQAADQSQKAKPAVKLEVRSWQEFEQLVAAHKGKIVVADIWTTTCGKCKEEFPKFLALQKQFSAKEVVLVSVNCDYDGIKDKPPAFYRPDVLKFLKKQHATIDNVMLDVAFIDFLNQLDLISTPAVLVYGRDGKLAKRFDNDDAEKVEDEFTIEQVADFVKTLQK